MNVFDSKNRETLIAEISDQEYDLLVIGGGATGSGIALDAASRGMKTLLVEKGDFASGTSSKSTKLIHGGLRYLKQFEIALVREVGRERAVVHRLAPHLVVNEKMLLPLIKDGTYGKLMTAIGLMVYDVLAGVESEDQRVMLSKKETTKQEPLLKEEILEGSGLYAEYRTDDARLSIEVLKAAASYGAHCFNYLEVRDFVYEDDRVSGALCYDYLSGQEITVKAKQVVSAAGPWVDELRAKNDSLEGKHLFLSKGVHIVVSHERFPLRQSIYFDMPDGRMVFAIPRGKITYIGTTDTQYFGDKNNPRTNIEDVEYLLHGANLIFPEVNLSLKDVESSWAGLRPLIHEEGKSASEISRKDEIFISETDLISIAGGKLTGYRKMAERVVDVVAKKLGKRHDLKFKKCTTDKITITGGGFKGSEEVKTYAQQVASQLSPHGIDPYQARYLVHNYGTQTDQILEIFAGMEEKSTQSLALAELRFTLENEMVHTAMDFFSRRTGRIYFDINSIRELSEEVLRYLQQYFGWDDTRMQRELAEVQRTVEEASNFPPRHETENVPTT
ncbi:MAG: glycerol-3-phosphate dehydrogenase/oxidase [Bacteroidota bacterium]